MVGASLLFAHTQAGIYIVAVAIIASFYFTVSGSWLLLIGAPHDETHHDETHHPE